MRYFFDIYTASAGILKGLAITFKTMLKPSVTVSYPSQKLKPYERYRGMLLFDAETCIGCNLCVKACPSACIALENQTNEQGKKIAKTKWYSIDFGKCNFCRLCEESCPTKAKSIWHSLDYEAVFFSRHEMVRCWQPKDPWIGTYWDPASASYKLPEGTQIPMEEEPVRR
ncbi:MAG: NADH-quinone oxidoreductase subunit I [Elusimicrobiota bacterium]